MLLFSIDIVYIVNDIKAMELVMHVGSKTMHYTRMSCFTLEVQKQKSWPKIITLMSNAFLFT